MCRCDCQPPKSIEQQLTDLEIKLNNTISLLNALNEHVYCWEHKKHRAKPVLETLEIRLGNDA